MAFDDPDQQAAYLTWLSAWAADHSDGCTDVPDIHVHCCWQHDYAYGTGLDPQEAFLGHQTPVTKEATDLRFRRCIQAESPFGRFSPMSWWRWLGVKWFGRGAFAPPHPNPL